MMKLPKELTTVTPVSKFLAMILLVSFPFVGFLVGLKYQQQFTEYIESRASVDQYLLKTQPTATQSASTADWQVYSAEFYTFKYPKDWKEIDNYGTGGTFIIEPANSKKVWIGFSLHTLINKSDTPEQLANGSLVNQTLITRKEILVDQHKAVYQEVKGAEGRPEGITTKVFIGNVEYIKIIRPGGSRLTTGTLVITMVNRDGSGQDLYKKTFDQILSTFKFTQ